MHKYAELLDEAIKKSGLSLTEISQRCESSGVKVTVSYLSKLRNRKMPPPSFMITAVLAKVLNIYPEKFLAAGVYDKQIEDIQELEKALTFVSPGLSRAQLFERTRIIVIYPQNLLNNEDGTIFFSSDHEYTDEEFEEIIEQGKGQIEQNDTNFEQIYLQNLVKVPVIGKIAAGSAITAEENVEGYVTVENTWNLGKHDLFALKIKGDSMINSRINDGDIVIIKKQPDVENGEIAAVLVNESEATLKKVKKYENGETWLFPANDKYAPIRIENENARILGKVIQVIFEP